MKTKKTQTVKGPSNTQPTLPLPPSPSVPWLLCKLGGVRTGAAPPGLVAAGGADAALHAAVSGPAPAALRPLAPAGRVCGLLAAALGAAPAPAPHPGRHGAQGERAAAPAALAVQLEQEVSIPPSQQQIRGVAVVKLLLFQ